MHKSYLWISCKRGLPTYICLFSFTPWETLFTIVAITIRPDEILYELCASTFAVGVHTSQALLALHQRITIHNDPFICINAIGKIKETQRRFLAVSPGILFANAEEAWKEDVLPWQSLSRREDGSNSWLYVWSQPAKKLRVKDLEPKLFGMV